MMMIRWFHTLHDSHATQFRDARVPHTQTQRYGILAMTGFAPKKPRDSARSALLTAVRSCLSGLAVMIIIIIIILSIHLKRLSALPPSPKTTENGS